MVLQLFQISVKTDLLWSVDQGPSIDQLKIEQVISEEISEGFQNK